MLASAEHVVCGSIAPVDFRARGVIVALDEIIERWRAGVIRRRMNQNEAPRWECVRRMLWQERHVFAFFATVSVAISVVFVFGQLGPEQTNFVEVWLRASLSKPWGILTAMFVHFEVEHYTQNLGSLLLMLIAFEPVNWSFELAAERRVSFPLWAVLGSAALANLLAVLIVPAPQPGSSPFGASGIVHGVIGATIGLGLTNTIHYAKPLAANLRRKNRAVLVPMLFFTNLTFSVGLLLEAAFSPVAFLRRGDKQCVRSRRRVFWRVVCDISVWEPACQGPTRGFNRVNRRACAGGD